MTKTTKKVSLTLEIYKEFLKQKHKSRWIRELIEIGLNIDLGKFDSKKRYNYAHGHAFRIENRLVSDFQALADNGFITYRGSGEGAGLQYPVRTDHGLWDIHENVALGLHYLLRGTDACYYIATRHIDEAIQTNSVVHFWFHPSFLSQKTFQILGPIFDYIAKKRNDRKLWTTTMSALASYCEAARSTSLEITRSDKSVTVTLNSKIDSDRFGDPEITLKIKIPESKKIKQVLVDDNKVKLDTEKCYTDTPGNDLIITVPVSSNKLTVEFE